MTGPVTTIEIADLLDRIWQLTQDRHADPRDQAAVLSLKAELLARIATQRADEWGPCDQTTEAFEIAREAQAIAQNAHRLARTPPDPTGGAKSQENPPPF
jgi:hypothetical protein